MDFIQFHINWKNYVRNRLLELLRRTGSENIFRKLDYEDREITVASFISDLDYSHRSFFSSAEQYALQRPESEQVFSPDGLERIPHDQGPEIFTGQLHENYSAMLTFLNNLTEQDLEKPLNHPRMSSDLDVGWIVQYTTLYEQSFTSGIKTILHYNQIEVRVPWATNKFMRPVKRLRLK